MGSTVPIPGLPDGSVAVSTSPSGSESLSITEMIVVRPARTPKSSSAATGVVLMSVRSGRVVSVNSSAVFSSSSSSPSGGVMSFQLSTRCMFSLAIHAVPPNVSFSTTILRLTRNMNSAFSSARSMSVAASCASRRQSRTKRFEPDHAAYVQPVSWTGCAGTPTAPPDGVLMGSPPPTGICTRASAVAIATLAAESEGCCRRAPAASSSCVVPPPRTITRWVS